ncbi:hypothetical protein OJ996_25540 [Luteolibacter sp. GHJ8]|uniref:Large polyvalent protein associated domain-containing protein n=1 Tax=Luteolibacter rhizosphaerae TaxID=2989719 RepID=A0ABT3GAV8_9BACT|nr:hypothetical protein [Luteolibacter rhizosphaerae]MCW1916978.1 hypothetical protein [Luteolibacter rhizosphaerae]
MPIIPDYKPAEGEHRPATGSPETAGLVGRANAKLGEAVGSIADSVLDLSKRYQQIRDSGVRNTARLEMQRAEAEGAEYRRANPDESLWEADRAQRTAKAQEKVLGMKMSPLAKAELQETFKAWDQEGQWRLGQEGMAQGVKRSRQAATDAALAYRKAGNYPAAIQVIQEATASQVFSKAEGAADIADTNAEAGEAVKKIQQKGVEKAAKENPKAILDKLKAKDADGNPIFEPLMEKGIRAGLELFAGLKLAWNKGVERESIKAGIDRGEITEREIMETPQYLDDDDKLALREHFRRVEMPDDEEFQWAWNTLGQIRDGFGGVKQGRRSETEFRESYGKAWGEIHRRLPQGFKGEILDVLESFSPARLGGNGMPAVATPPRHEAILEMNGVLKRAYDAHIFGRTDGTKDQLTAARAEWSRAHTEASRWLEQRGDTVSAEEARKHAESLLQVPRVTAGKTLVSESVAGFGVKLTPFNFASGKEGIGADQPPKTWEEVRSKIDGN